MAQSYLVEIDFAWFFEAPLADSRVLSFGRYQHSWTSGFKPMIR